MIRTLAALLLLLLLVASGALAADPATAPAAVPQDPQQLLLDDLHTRLARFADQWLATLRRSQLSGPGNCEVLRGPDGRYVARYQHIQEGVAPICLVRASELKPGAYIGSIQYKVELFECSGDTPQAAKAGPFEAVSRMTMNEIFSIQSKDAPWTAPK